MTIALYARRKQWPLEGVVVRLEHSRIHAVDCAECETKEGMLDRIDREISLSGALTEEQRARLLWIAERCPVHRTLTSEVTIRSLYPLTAHTKPSEEPVLPPVYSTIVVRPGAISPRFSASSIMASAMRSL